MNKYTDRIEAGKMLAQSLIAYANRKDCIVLALPRGGVPVAYEITKKLNLPLDVFICRRYCCPLVKPSESFPYTPLPLSLKG